MDIIKNHLWNKFGDEFINDCLIAYIERDVVKYVDSKSIMKRFQNMYS